MSLVLVVNDTPKYQHILDDALQAGDTPAEVIYVSSRAEALKVIDSGEIATMVINPYMSKMCAADLVGYMYQYQPATPLVIVVSSPDLQETQTLLNSYPNVYGYLSEPSDSDLITMVQPALRSFGRDKGLALDGTVLGEELQELGAVCQNGRLEVNGPSFKQGFVYVVEGRLQHAFLLALQGEGALVAMLAWPEVSLRLHNLPMGGSRRTIYTPLVDLLLHAKSPIVNSSDEPPKQTTLPDIEIAPIVLRKPKSSVVSTPPAVVVKSKPPSARATAHVPAKPTPPAPLAKPVAPAKKITPKPKSNAEEAFLAKAIGLALANEESKARAIITALLKKNPKNAKYWLWLSRVANNFNSIIKAHNNASLLLPNNLEIQEEDSKIKAALLAGFPRNVEAFHCPFCWAPVQLDTQSCFFCKAHQFVHNDVLTKPQDLKYNVMHHALDRYEKVVSGKCSDRSYYNLAILNLNIDRVNACITALQKAGEMAPDNLFYSGQLKDLYDLLANNKARQKGGELELNDLPQDSTTSPVKKNVVLVVEDSNTTRKAICLMLSQEGYDIMEASDGMEALSICKERVPDLILLDLIMPVMDGYQVLAALKKDSILKQVPVIMLTARASLLDKVKGKMSASNEYLTKPFKSHELMAKVCKYL